MRLTLLILLLTACKPKDGEPSNIVDRQPGDRTPLSGLCDDMDPVRCILPWPSNTFTGLDNDTQTGLRVVVTPQSLPIDDDVEFMNSANGFSRSEEHTSELQSRRSFVCSLLREKNNTN